MPSQNAKPVSTKGLIRISTLVFVLAAIYLLEQHSFILFHSFAEICSIVVIWSVFVLTFNTRRYMQTGYFIFLGTGFLFAGMFNLFHTLAYKEMDVFPGSSDGNLATQFWIVTRYLLSFSLLLAPLFLRKKTRLLPLFAGFLIVSTVLILTILWRPVFPVCFIPGEGLTPFKKISEYIICVILIASLWLLKKNRAEFHADVFRLLCWSIALMIASELVFTLYKDISGLLNALGHLLSVLALLMIYKAIIEKGLVHPSDLLFYDLKQHEAALRTRENEFRALFEFSGIGLAQIDPVTGQFMRINRKFCEITGYGALELKGTACINLVFPEDGNTNWLTTKMCPPGCEHAEQKKYIHKNGSIIRVEETCTTITDTTGFPLYILIAVQDITRRVEIETALLESEQRYRTLFNSMTTGFALHEIICDNQGTPCDYRFLEINPAFEQITGLKRADVIGRTHREVLPGDGSLWVAEFGSVALTGTPARFESNSPTLNRYYDICAYCPAPWQVAATFMDITRLKQLRDELSYLASFPMLNQHPVIEADMDGNIRFANPAAQRLLPDIEQLGRKHPWMTDWESVVFACNTPDGVLPDREVTVDGRCFHQSMRFLPESRRVRMYGVDITGRKLVEQTLVQSEKRLQAALIAGRTFMFEWHPTKDEVHRSENCAVILGLDPKNCTRDTALNYFKQIHPEDRDRFATLLRKLVPAAPDYKTEYRYVQENGKIVWLEERGLAEFDEKGALSRVCGVAADITDRVEAHRRQTKAVAAASAARSAIDTVNAMGEGVILMQLDGTVMNANPAALRMTGFRQQDVVGRNINDLLPQLIEDTQLDAIKNALGTISQKKVPQIPIVMLRRPQNLPVYISPSVVFIESRQGQPATVVLTLKDITALHENTKILERVFDNSHISIVYLDPQFNFVRVNRIYADTCGKPADFFPGKNHFELYPHEENEKIFRQVVASGKPYSVYDKPFEFPDHPEWGVTYWDWSLQPVKDEHGRVEALVFCLQDTTMRKTALLALEESERKYRELVENANSIIMRITPDHRVTFFNEYAQQFFGYSEEEVLGRSVLETIIPPIDSDGNDLRQMTEAITAHPEIYSTNENENLCKNGQRVWISWTNKVVRDEQGNAVEILCIGTDATTRKRIQDENHRYQQRLRRLAEQLAAGEEEERWQISRYIHDTIIQNLSLSSMKLGALQDPLTETGTDEQILNFQATRQLIDEAIGECRTVMSELTPPLLYELGLTSALIEFANHIRERHCVSVAIENTGELDHMDNTLRGLLFQSARELVMNALKHAKCLHICISVNQIGNEVRVCVRDDGRGFDPALLANHRATNNGGFGLFSVRERVENLGGRLEIQSAPGRGTEITISVPVH